MAKTREAIPRTVKDLVLKEFNHRCAICAADRPQLHHIDEDPSNNKPENLIPLCPNCHLTDQHDPTRPIDAEKLQLFRQFKDPSILKPQFHPLFVRMQFLNPVDETAEVEKLANSAKEIIELVAVLKMGEFYSKLIAELIKRNYASWPRAVVKNGMATSVTEYAETEEQYISKIRNSYLGVSSLAIELLRFQQW